MATTNTQEVELLMPHEHGGIQYQAGDKISLYPQDIAWLVDLGVVAEPAKPTAKK